MTIVERPIGQEDLDPISWAPPAEGDRLETPEPTGQPFEYLLSGWWSPESVATASGLVDDVDALLGYLDELALLDHRIRARGDLQKLARRAARNARRMREVIEHAVPPDVSTGMVPADASLPAPPVEAPVEAPATVTTGRDMWGARRRSRVRRWATAAE